VEVLQRWLGDITGVFARGKIIYPIREGYEVIIPDLLTVLCSFENGAEGVLEFSSINALAQGDRLEIYGGTGTLTYDFTSDIVHAGKLGDRALHVVDLPPELEGEWRVEEDFLAAVKSKGCVRPHPTFEDGVRYMRVVQAVADSRARNEWVAIKSCSLKFVAGRLCQAPNAFGVAKTPYNLSTRSRQQPVQALVKISQRGAFDRIIMICAVQCDHAFFSGVSVNHQLVITRGNYFIPFREQENRPRVTRPRVLDSVEVPRDLRSDWTCQQPQVPPAEPTQNHFTQRHRIMQNQPGDGALRSHMERSRRTDACAVRDDWPIARVTF
jgi:hypothetical protein